MPDQLPSPLKIDHGPLLTLKEAAILANRPMRVLRHWTHTGVLRSVYRETKWPYRKLVLQTDLYDALRGRKAWGKRKTNIPRTLTTEGGRAIPVHGYERTDSALPEDEPTQGR
jgi:hypothetical protein